MQGRSNSLDRQSGSIRLVELGCESREALHDRHEKYGRFPWEAAKACGLEFFVPNTALIPPVDMRFYLNIPFLSNGYEGDVVHILFCHVPFTYGMVLNTFPGKVSMDRHAFLRCEGLYFFSLVKSYSTPLVK